MRLLALLHGIPSGRAVFLNRGLVGERMASTLSPLLYVQLVWATLLGWIVFGHLADLPTTIGMLIIGGSSLSLALRWPRRLVGRMGPHRSLVGPQGPS